MKFSEYKAGNEMFSLITERGCKNQRGLSNRLTFLIRKVAKTFLIRQIFNSVQFQAWSAISSQDANLALLGKSANLNHISMWLTSSSDALSCKTTTIVPASGKNLEKNNNFQLYSIQAPNIG